MMIVVVLIGIMAAAMVSSATPAVHDKLLAAARLTAADVAYCRNLAVTNNSTYRIVFDTADDRYYIEHTGSDTSLDSLPYPPHRNENDPANQHIVVFDERPQFDDLSVELEKVQAVADTTTTVASLEFGPLGATTRSEETAIWLTAGNGDEQRFISLRVNPVTGLTWIDQFQTTGPTNSESAYSSPSVIR